MFHAFVPGHADANVGTALRISDGSLAIGRGRIQALTIVAIAYKFLSCYLSTMFCTAACCMVLLPKHVDHLPIIHKTGPTRSPKLR